MVAFVLHVDSQLESSPEQFARLESLVSGSPVSLDVVAFVVSRATNSRAPLVKSLSLSPNNG